MSAAEKIIPNVELPRVPSIEIGAVDKREKRYVRWVTALIASNILTIIFFGLVITAMSLRTDPIIAIDPYSGRVLGEYRTTAERNDDEIKGGAERFVKCYRSLNSQTIYRDAACAVSMMGDRFKSEYLEQLNKTKQVLMTYESGVEAHVKVDSFEIISNKQIFKNINSPVDDLIASTESSITVAEGEYINIVKVDISGRNIISDIHAPFRLVLTMQLLPITTSNTSGIKVLKADEYEY